MKYQSGNFLGSIKCALGLGTQHDAAVVPQKYLTLAGTVFLPLYSALSIFEKKTEYVITV